MNHIQHPFVDCTTYEYGIGTHKDCTCCLAGASKHRDRLELVRYQPFWECGIVLAIYYSPIALVALALAI